MTTETTTPQSRNFVTSVLPWLLAAGMFAVFLASLNHWVTPGNLSAVVEINGWKQNAHLMGPVTYLVTYPLRALPVNMVPLALNLFAALCAALTLSQLARSVALLPHDRTYEQRQREQSEFSFLTIRTAWVPPLFAVLACGLQLTFWENAINATGEMFDLLIFAFVVRCLLEYRIWHVESWLVRFALVYGLGMANNWAMVGFFPLFLVALVWMKGLPSLNPVFMLRTAGLGLAGFSLFFMFPLLNSIHHGFHQGFWHYVHLTVASEKLTLTTFPRDVVMVLALSSLLPVLVISMRWASYFGDNSPLGIFMATSMFHLIHAMFFLACMWVMLDAPISPRMMGYGLAFLPFYYLCALCIGYFAGYFLLVFGTPVARSKTAPNPFVRLINLLVTVCVWLLLIALPLVLVRKNLPYLQSNKTVYREIEHYFARLLQALPPQGAVVLCDDSAEPYSMRLAYLEASLRREGKNSPHLLVSASSFTLDPSYLAFLQRRNPAYELPSKWTNIVGDSPSALDALKLLDRLSQKHPLYYLHPSFGSIFEHFYAEPQGLVYRLNVYPTNVWDAPLPTPTQIAFNQSYWKQTVSNDLQPLIDILHQPDSPTHPGYWDALMLKLHLKPEHERYAPALGALYSRALDNWGVELERSGHVDEAGKTFDQAGLLNPYNISAGINKYFNQKLLAGKEIIVQPPKNLEEKLGQHRNWVETLTVDGPIDEPNYRVDLAEIFGEGGNYRQCVQHFDRVKELAPDNLRIRLQLTQLLIYIQMHPNDLAVFIPNTTGYSLACSNADEVLRRAPDQPTALFLKSVALMQLQAFDQAIDPLNRLISQEATNYTARLDRGISYFKIGNLAAAKPDYEAVQAARPYIYQASYGLAKIAEQENNKPAAIRNYELYLANAPTNSAEAMLVYARLKELKQNAPKP